MRLPNPTREVPKMSIKATPVAPDQAGQPGVTETQTYVEGVGNVSVYIKVEKVDDVTEAVTDDVQTLRFSVPVWVEPVAADEEKGIEAEEGYWKVSNREIDLGKKNRDAFLKSLDKYLTASREIQAPAPRTVAAKKSTTGPNPELTEWRRRVRTWLTNEAPASVTHGEKVPDRGVLKGAWEAAYVEKHPQDPKPE
ncbi:Lsr2 family protein [Streptomyces sp. ISL-10]|uniref:Lsr2 family protein n=1 Tax=Streptomyces sp. ISL-10 TaxID=2819172 RepID=UPI001BEB027B|nr:Lsr2 family protein [Streptomyces sp. ISL-10]MBT2365250.1 Lsr2 family protein [Streptomyces sp. ISL-10]